MVKRIKVIHFVSGMKNGGVEEILKNYTELLNKNCPIENIIVYQHEANKARLNQMTSIGNKLVEIPYKKEHPLKNLIATYSIIKKEKPDVVHAHMNLLNFFPLSIAKLLNVKVRISHAHIANDNVNHILAPVFKKLNLLFANYNFACGEKAGKYMFGRKKFYIIYNAINQNKFKYNVAYREKLRREFNVSDNTIILGTIGRLTKQKNQVFLIKLFKKYNSIIPNSRLFIVGNGELENYLVNYAKNNGIQNKIYFINETSNPQKFYSLFDYFLLPSLYEGLPLVAVEAQASGINTILSDNIDRSVKFNSNVSFLPLNSNKWITKIRESKKNFRSQINEKNCYNIGFQYNKLFNLYINFLNK